MATVLEGKNTLKLNMQTVRNILQDWLRLLLFPSYNGVKITEFRIEGNQTGRRLVLEFEVEETDG